jgi:hypothetical protein
MNRKKTISAFFGIYLEKGGRLGLKCLLLSYFRVGDHPPGTHKTVRESELETCLRLISSTQDHDQEDR